MFRSRLYLFLACLAGMAVANADVRSQNLATGESKSLVGTWTGQLSAGAAELKLVLRFEQDPNGDGRIAGSFESPNSGRTGRMQLDSLHIDQSEVRFAVAGAPISFVGKLDAKNDDLAGIWTQGQQFRVRFTRSDGALAPMDPKNRPNRPQEPERPYPYDEQEVVIENEGVTLAGTLTIPRGNGPFPAVVLVSGSGPQDRDESIMGHRPFFILADHLTRLGIAVLRCDDRGVGKSTGVFDSSTIFDFTNDALAAVRFCQQHEQVDSRKVGICGHSLGGLVAPLVATEAPELAFIVLMAGPGVTGERILQRQAELEMEALDLSAHIIRRNHELRRKLFSIVKNEEDSETIAKKLRDAAA